MKFGLNERRALTGTECAVRVFQIATLLPLLFFLILSGYPALIMQTGLFAALFDLGCMVLPRAELWGAAALYRLSMSEIAVFFSILALALFIGLAAGRLLKGSSRCALLTRWIYAGWIALDLFLRLLLRAPSFPLWAAVIGFCVRLACLIFVLLDLRAAKKAV